MTKRWHTLPEILRRRTWTEAIWRGSVGAMVPGASFWDAGAEEKAWRRWKPAWMFRAGCVVSVSRSHLACSITLSPACSLDSSCPGYIGSASCQGGNGQGVQPRIQSLAKKLLSESSFPWPLSTEPMVILSTSCLRRQWQSLSEHLQRRKVTRGACLTRLTSGSQKGSPTTWSLPYTLITFPCPNFPFQGFSSVGRNMGWEGTEKFFTTSSRFSHEIMEGKRILYEE